MLQALQISESADVSYRSNIGQKHHWPWSSTPSHRRHNPVSSVWRVAPDIVTPNGMGSERIRAVLAFSAPSGTPSPTAIIPTRPAQPSISYDSIPVSTYFARSTLRLIPPILGISYSLENVGQNSCNRKGATSVRH
jgi:hypothetical protein